jgi:membrane-associated protein
MEALIDLFCTSTSSCAVRAAYGAWVYACLFLIIFAETGLVVTPFLPATRCSSPRARWPRSGRLQHVDSGAAADRRGGARRRRELRGRQTPSSQESSPVDRTSFWHRALNRDHLRQGACVLREVRRQGDRSRPFVPIVRTFVPFVAGAGTMTYDNFALYNVHGVA